MSPWYVAGQSLLQQWNKKRLVPIPKSHKTQWSSKHKHLFFFFLGGGGGGGGGGGYSKGQGYFQKLQMS